MKTGRSPLRSGVAVKAGEATSTVEVGTGLWVSAGVAALVGIVAVRVAQDEMKKRSENIYSKDFFTIIAR